MRIMTCNIRVCTAHDGDNAWDHRKELLTKVIRRYEPDVIGFQEMRKPQWAFLHEQLAVYDWFGLTRVQDSPDPYNAIFWRKSRFELISPGGYWLSETPHVTGSASWDSSEARYANWVRLRDLEKDIEFRLINTHLDHRGEIARPKQVRVIHEDSQHFDKNYPQILTGDFNADPASPAVESTLKAGWRDTYQLIHGNDHKIHTIHNFKGEAANGTKRIDYVFVRGPITSQNTQVIKDHEGDLYPSDHYFVLADVSIDSQGA